MLKIPKIPKIPKRISIIISQAFTAAVFLLVLAAAAFLPRLISKYFNKFDGWQFYVIFYSILAVGFAISLLLWFLLDNIRKGSVFEEANVTLLRLLSWCCITEAAIFLAFARYFFISLLVAFGCLFMAVILRVVKNVMEEATSIKRENDYTI